MHFRIKHHVGIGYFAQVWTGIFRGWKTIGSHISGYGLYPDNHINYPKKSSEEAQEIARSYSIWKSKVDDGNVTYEDLEIK